jgi:1-phosphofructokinase
MESSDVGNVTRPEVSADLETGEPVVDEPRVAVLGSHPLLSITIERRGAGEDDIHVHAAGQGVWVARMVGEMGAYPILCSFCGGETGSLLGPLLDELPGEVRRVGTNTTSGCYVVDRRAGERDMIAHAWSDPPARHEIDDLFSVTCTAALDAHVLVLCGQVPPEALPVEFYGRLVANTRAHGTQSIVDMSPPRLNGALEGGPDVVKLDEWQLGEFVGHSVENPDEFRSAAEKLLERGARSVIVTQGAEPALVLRDGAAWTLAPPRFEGGAPEGTGDSMVGALAAALAQGLGWEDSLRLAAAAGAANFLRHGLGTGSHGIVEELVDRVELRSL